MIHGASLSDASKSAVRMHSGSGKVIVSQGAQELVTTLLTRADQQKIFDFDDHLADPSKDFRNLFIGTYEVCNI